MKKAKFDIKKLKEQLLARIDTEDMQQLEKVERYVSLVQLQEKLHADIAKEGTLLVTKNGAQEFFKSNPATGELQKINTSLLALEKSMGLENAPAAAPKETPKSGKKADEQQAKSNVRPLRPVAADLI